MFTITVLSLVSWTMPGKEKVRGKQSELLFGKQHWMQATAKTLGEAKVKAKEMYKELPKGQKEIRIREGLELVFEWPEKKFA